MKKRIKQIQKKKKDIESIFIYIITFIIIYLIITKNKYLFASTIDFKDQHYLIPEYFRTYFYQNHNLFPDFALNLGSGQNIYYFSYYGLYNPTILISYLLPKIKMIDYLITMNCLTVLISTTLFYIFLKRNKFHQKTCFITAFLFLVSTPIIFHAKRHIMFINYFPYLILSLILIDHYFQTKKTTLLTISISLLILTSYYFSISSIIVILIYSIYKYQSQTNKIKTISLYQHSKKIIKSILISIMITSILTFPTIYTLLNGRITNQSKPSITKLFTPSITSTILYNPYSIGLTIISLISIIYLCIKGKKATKFLSITCLLITFFPICNYILNGTLYINSKSLIPFTTLILYLTAIFLNPYLKQKSSIKQTLLLSYLIIVPFSICIMTNQQDKLIKKSDLTNFNTKTTKKWINEIINQDHGFYRINTDSLKETGYNQITNIKEYKTSLYSSTSNQNYLEFQQNILNNPIPNRNLFMISPSTNPLSLILLSEKYIITEKNLGTKLKKMKQENNLKLYQNNNILPLGYASSQLLSTKTINNLTYPNNIINLIKNISIQNPIQENQNLINLQQESLNYQIINKKNINYYKKKNIINIKAKKNAYLKIKINKNMQNKILFLRFKVKSNQKQDLTITINQIKNKLTAKNWKYYNKNQTFDYVIDDPNILNIEIKEGIYQISKIETYILDYEQLESINQEINPLKITKIKGNTIIGNINVTNNNSYFTISIPYDKGFKIIIDRKKTNYEKTATNFIAFPIKKGKHKIQITYHAPYKKESILISIIGIFFLILNFKKEITSKNH